MGDASEGRCVAVLSDRFKRYLDLCVPESPDAFCSSLQDCVFKPRRDERFVVLLRGDGVSDRPFYVRCEDGLETWIATGHTDLKVVEGTLRAVPKRGRIHLGKTSLMGSIAIAIRSGKVFRGR